MGEGEEKVHDLFLQTDWVKDSVSPLQKQKNNRIGYFESRSRAIVGTPTIVVTYLYACMEFVRSSYAAPKTNPRLSAKIFHRRSKVTSLFFLLHLRVQ